MWFGFVLIVVGIFFYSRSMSSDLIETMAMEEARHYSNVLVEFRTLYTREVVEKLRDSGIVASHDFHGKPQTIPLPATLTKLLGRPNSASETNLFRLYSPYPFRHHPREKTMPDSYAKEAWEFLNKNPTEPFVRIDYIESVPTLRFATADLMRAECVNCHNTHPASPKTDWQTGDVRGILEVAVPLAPGVSVMDTRLRDLVIFLIVFLGVVVWLLTSTIDKARKNYLSLLNEREY
jgi:hypothetical protein